MGNSKGIPNCIRTKIQNIERNKMLSSLISADETYRLRWNRTQIRLSDEFKNLRDNDDLFDVSLSSTVNNYGSKLLRAHKVLLSAYSNTFKEMLRQHPSKLDPIIYLKGTSFNDLNNLLDFMYNGEVNILHSELDSFMSLAQELQIKGLQTADDNINQFDLPYERDGRSEKILGIKSVKEKLRERMQVNKTAAFQTRKDALNVKTERRDSSILDSNKKEIPNLISFQNEMRSDYLFADEYAIEEIELNRRGEENIKLLKDVDDVEKSRNRKQNGDGLVLDDTNITKPTSPIEAAQIDQL